MPIAISPKAPTRYVLEAEREQDSPTVFLIVPPTYKLHELVWNNASTEDVDGGFAGRIQLGTSLRLTCQQCLVGWENFNDEGGNPVPFAGKKHATEADLEHLTFEDITELANAVRDLSKLTEEERGK